MTGNVVISEVAALMNFVLSKTEKHVSYGELVGTIKYITLSRRCRTNRDRYNRFQPHLFYERPIIKTVTLKFYVMKAGFNVSGMMSSKKCT